MEILTILTTGALCIVSFIMGAKTVQNVKKDKDIELPNINPLKAIRERQEQREQKKLY